jgi:hypothetical protein
MKLKVRLAAIASGLALVGGLTIAFAGPASASLGTGELCTYAFANGLNPFSGNQYCATHKSGQIAVSLSEGSGADWAFDYNPSGSAWSEIDLLNSSGDYIGCMAVTTADTVEVATCNGDNTELFEGIEYTAEDATTGAVMTGIWFVNKETGLCLSSVVSTNDVRAEECVLEEVGAEYFPSPNQYWIFHLSG